jgi:hypothetical protein
VHESLTAKPGSNGADPIDSHEAELVETLEEAAAIRQQLAFGGVIERLDTDDSSGDVRTSVLQMQLERLPGGTRPDDQHRWDIGDLSGDPVEELDVVRGVPRPGPARLSVQPPFLDLAVQLDRLAVLS